ncbi:MAG: hypothetical protein KF897_17665 [Opitutaceae bacterium]|nr:hypothetical protein [Opitutaceae bacterium]
MPNQLAQTKRRQSLAEHAAVLAALAQVARTERTTVMALLREAARAAVRQRTANPTQAQALRKVVWDLAPRTPARFKTAAQLARFKRAQREFDTVVLDLQLAAPAEIQARNSLVPRRSAVRLVNFDQDHGAVV